MNKLKKSIAVATLGGAGTIAVLMGRGLVDNVRYAWARDEVNATREQLSTVQDMSSVFRKVGTVVEPSVVNIVVHKSVKTGKRALPFDDDMLRRFFPDRNGDGQPDLPPGFGGGEGGDDAAQETVGTGSGVIMEAQGGSGFILTNNHVAGGATELSVTLADGRVIKGDKVKVLGADPKTDLAVVKIEADRLIPAKWGDSDQLARGDWVMAFGSPFGYIGSMTHGIVSALNRQAGILAQQQGYENFIQVDAPINPGNSGGPLTNVHGEVVGINTAIASRSGSFSGLGFAIPSNQAKVVYASLKEKGRVTRGWLGVSISDVSKDVALAHSFGFKGDKGVIVQDAFANTPATGKLQRGDIVTELDGKAIDDVQELRNRIATTSPNTEVHFKVFRDGKTQDVALKVGEQPEDLVALAHGGPAAPGEAASKGAEALGMQLTTPSDVQLQRFGMSDVKGALVTRVLPNSAAYKAGIREGDVITRVGKEDVTTAEQASAAIGKQDKSKGIRFYVTSSTGSRFVFVEPS